MRMMIMMALFGLMMVLSPVSYAADGDAATKPTKIAVVDVQGLISESKAGKSIQAQINKQRESFKEEFSKLEKELGDMQKKMGDDKSPEYAAKKKEFESKMMDANKLVQDRRQVLEKAAAEAVMELRKEIVRVTADIADQEKYTIVITRQDVVLAEKDMDITQQVLTALDKKLPDVKVNMDSAKAAAPAADKPKKK